MPGEQDMAEEEALAQGTQALSVSAADSLDVNNSKQALPNLPLPRELRDQIWGYLLHHKHVHAALYEERPETQRGKTSEENDRSTSRAHTYKFNTQILAVNRQIHEEATKVFHNNNFILVSHKWPIQGKPKHQFNVPIVSENQAHLSRMKCHILRVHIQGSNKLLAKFLDNHTENVMKSILAFCIVAEELPLLCSALQRVFYTIPPLAKLIAPSGNASPPFVELDPDSAADVYVKTNIQFRFKQAFAEKSDFARKLLTPFRDVVYGGQRVNVLNCDDSMSAEIRELKKSMSPKVVWVRAMMWNILENILKEIDEAHAYVEADNLFAAALTYERTLGMVGTPWIFKLPKDMYQTDVGVPFALLCVALMNAGVTFVFITVKLSNSGIFAGRLFRDLTGLIGMLNRVSHETRALVASEELVSTLSQGETSVTACRACWCATMLSLLNIHDPEDKIQEIMESLQDLQPALKDCAGFEDDLRLVESLESDRELLRAYVKDNKLVPSAAEMTSACQLPVEVYKSPVPAACKKPDGLDGFFDKEHYEKIRSWDPELAATLV